MTAPHHSRPSPTTFARRAGAPLVALILAGTGLVGCAGADPQPDASSANSNPAAGSPDPIYGQTVEWSDCGQGGPANAQCGEIEAPLDWDDPTGDSITLALARVQTANSKSRLGSLVFNPGGPGASGIEFLASLPTVIPATVQAAYDLVSFDPRGVGRSTPVDCLDDLQMDEYFAASFPHDEAGLAAASEAAANFGLAYAERTGELLGFVDTGSAARDLDLIRALLGDERLNYVGYSYGSLLGVAYAELFPERVGRLVLDSAADPAKSADELSLEQAAAFDRSLAVFAAACAATSDCPLGDDADQILADVVTLLKNLLEQPLALNDGRYLTQQMALSGIIGALYSDANWMALGAGLYTAAGGKGEILSQLNDAYLGRDPASGHYSNLHEAIPAITCLNEALRDNDPSVVAAQYEALRQAAPVLGQFSSRPSQCANWPVPARSTPHAASAPGAAAILVIGATGDPATPYAQAVALAEQLESGVLLTYEGERHTVYGLAGSQCVDDAVNAFLIDGAVPAEGTRC
ncbi:MAG: alpha/beta hydrolase [Propionibacteriaceae bacterium]|nr:alpha/beta hydrolase [Propionibacteriaceae bacterium]